MQALGAGAEEEEQRGGQGSEDVVAMLVAAERRRGRMCLCFDSLLVKTSEAIGVCVSHVCVRAHVCVAVRARVSVCSCARARARVLVCIGELVGACARARGHTHAHAQHPQNVRRPGAQLGGGGEWGKEVEAAKKRGSRPCCSSISRA